MAIFGLGAVGFSVSHFNSSAYYYNEFNKKRTYIVLSLRKISLRKGGQQWC
jgi:hypothetical protein